MSSRAVWRHSTAAERVFVVAALVLLVVLAGLAALEPLVLPMTYVVLLLAAAGLLWQRARTRQRQTRERLPAAEAERGVWELQRWLAAGPRA